jgi:hypothetical protein
VQQVWQVPGKADDDSNILNLAVNQIEFVCINQSLNLPLVHQGHA